MGPARSRAGGCIGGRFVPAVAAGGRPPPPAAGWRRRGARTSRTMPSVLWIPWTASVRTSGCVATAFAQLVHYHQALRGHLQRGRFLHGLYRHADRRRRRALRFPVLHETERVPQQDPVQVLCRRRPERCGCRRIEFRLRGGRADGLRQRRVGRIRSTRCRKRCSTVRLLLGRHVRRPDRRRRSWPCRRT